MNEKQESLGSKHPMANNHWWLIGEKIRIKPICYSFPAILWDIDWSDSTFLFPFILEKCPAKA